VAGEVNFS